jgi:hypothetical protein
LMVSPQGHSRVGNRRATAEDSIGDAVGYGWLSFERASDRDVGRDDLNASNTGLKVHTELWRSAPIFR